MNYVNFHIGDWLGGTALLSATERGVYFDLICRYYREERAVTKEECERIARAYSKTEKAAQKYVLGEFFTYCDGAYHHNRCEEEVQKAAGVSEKRKQSAKARWSKAKDVEKPSRKRAEIVKIPCEGVANIELQECKNNANADANADASADVLDALSYAIGMQDENECNALTINQYPLTKEIEKKEEKKKREKKTEPLVFPSDVSEELKAEYLTYRPHGKKHVVTQRIINAQIAEAEKAGLSLSAALEYAMGKGWTGFNANYWANAEGRKLSGGAQTAQSNLAFQTPKGGYSSDF